MLVGLLKTIFFLLTFYYLFKLIGRILVPLLLKKTMERMQDRQQAAANAYQEKARQQEGKVTIKTKTQKKNNPVSENQGEYVDYEEVD